MRWTATGPCWLFCRERAPAFRPQAFGIWLRFCPGLRPSLFVSQRSALLLTTAAVSIAVFLLRSSAFHCLSSALHCLCTTFHRPFHCLSSAFTRFFLGLTTAFRSLTAAACCDRSLPLAPPHAVGLQVKNTAFALWVSTAVARHNDAFALCVPLPSPAKTLHLLCEFHCLRRLRHCISSCAFHCIRGRGHCLSLR